MSKFDEILNSSDASDALLGEQIDKINEAVESKISNYVSESGNAILSNAYNSIYPNGTGYKSFLVDISYDDGNYYVAVYHYKLNTAPIAIQLAKSTSITAVNTNNFGTLAPTGVSGTATFAIVGIS